jgi:hypothetical protein
LLGLKFSTALHRLGFLHALEQKGLSIKPHHELWLVEPTSERTLARNRSQAYIHDPDLRQ